ncbi:ATP-binding cassette domain-containing protein [Jeotgalibaca sp. MA1X17-3]|uniref:ABC transporter ATP-binding protein n=1 Tax=Jeotgalibaca sp. MA1X17-3 TaxID=2908211 RepID=UPI001F1DEA36|nr:ATP-binding cassette domain-containing protein [Jeotgalibaca sp. MA1X17-3]UJF14762.1 ATP-binding cassette domain-containing protein [Jeotgalibaca sp. MA1X17-3]
MSNANTILELTDVYKTFYPGSINEVKALSDINLDVRKGDFITLVGGNGAGKSTLLNAISGQFLPDSGMIRVNQKDITFLHENQRAPYISRVFQDPKMGTAPSMSVQENLSLAYRRGQARKLRYGSSKEERKLFQEQLKSLGLGLENRMNSEIGLLSGGQRQSIALLMATLKRPDILLLDEHTAALDPKTARLVLELTDKKVREMGLTSIMITHNLQDAITYGNRMLVLHHGRIVNDYNEAEKEKLTTESLFSELQALTVQDILV